MDLLNPLELDRSTEWSTDRSAEWSAEAPLSTCIKEHKPIQELHIYLPTYHDIHIDNLTMFAPNWRDFTVSLIRDVPPEPHASDYSGYLYVLWELFPVRQHTLGPFVCPERTDLEGLADSDNPRDAVRSYIVHDGQQTELLVLEICTPAALASTAARKDADARLRQRIAEYAPKRPRETFHAVSAFGRRLSFYTGTVRDGEVHIEPPLGPNPDDPAPMSRWNCDVLEPEGIARLRAIGDETNALFPPDVEST